MESDTGPKESFVQGLKIEWSLLWHNILGDEPEDKKAEIEKAEIHEYLDATDLNAFSPEKLKVISKALSHDRKKLNQSMEIIHKELDEMATKLDSLRLVGGETKETENRINELSDMGLKLSEKLNWLTEKLKVTRQVERKLRSQEK